MSQNTDATGRSILKQVSAVNDKLKKSLAGGVDNIDETLKLLKESQPLRKKLLPRIKNEKLRATYNKIIENVQQLLDGKPSGKSGQAKIVTSLKNANKIFSS